jgi:hypothetical protein
MVGYGKFGNEMKDTQVLLSGGRVTSKDFQDILMMIV